MKLLITRENMTKLLGACIAIARPKSPSAILSCVLLETAGESLRGAATDLIQNITTTVPATVEQSGGVAVNARDLLDRVKMFPAGPIQMVAAKGKLTMTAGKRKHVISTLSPEDFPAVVEPSGQAIVLPGDVLKRLLARTKFAMSKDESRPHMNGVGFTREPGCLRTFSTDGARLATGTEVVEGLEAGVPFIVPAPAVEAVHAILDDGEVKMHAAGPMLWFSVGATTLATKVPEAKFPDVRSFFESEPPDTFTAPAAQLLSALRSVERASKDGKDDARRYVALELATGIIHVHAEGKGEAEDEVESTYNGRKFTLGMCSEYFCDAIEAAGTETVRISVTPGEELSPVWVRPDEGTAGLVLCMPSRV